MRDYLLLQFRRIRRNRWLAALMAACLLVIPVCYGYCCYTASSLRYERESFSRYEYILKNDLMKLEENDEYYSLIEQQIREIQENRNTENERIVWKSWYLDQIVQYKMLIQKENMQSEISQKKIDDWLNRIAYYRYYYDHDTEFIYEEDHRTGYAFMYYLMDFLPLLICILISVAMLYGTMHYDRSPVWTCRMLPVSSLKRTAADILFGFLVGLIFSALFMCTAFVLACVIYRMGSAQMPVRIYEYTAPDAFVSLVSVIPSALALYLSSLLFTAAVSELIVTAIRNTFGSLLVLVLLLIGLPAAVKTISSLGFIAGLLPFTYLNITGIVSQKIAVFTQNPSLTAAGGIITLLLSSLLCFAVLLFVRRQQRG